MEIPTRVVAWQRLHEPGYDVCHVRSKGDTTVLSGMATFFSEGAPCAVTYEVVADAAFVSKRARIRGHYGKAAIDLHFDRARGGRWRSSGAIVPLAEACLDFDLGFSPSTNFLAIRRLGLRVGESRSAPAAWLDFPRTRIVALPQIYHRTGAKTYAYRAPTVGYEGVLEVSRAGDIVAYPGLFEATQRTSSRR